MIFGNGRRLQAAWGSFARRRAGPGGPAQAWRPAPPYLLQLSGGEEDGLLQRVQGGVEQGFALRQIGPLLSLRPEAEVVITTLVDVQPHGFAGCGEGIVQRDGDRHQAVCGAHQNQDPGSGFRFLKASGFGGEPGGGNWMPRNHITAGAPTMAACTGTLETRFMTRLPPRLTP